MSDTSTPPPGTGTPENRPSVTVVVAPTSSAPAPVTPPPVIPTPAIPRPATTTSTFQPAVQPAPPANQTKPQPPPYLLMVAGIVVLFVVAVILLAQGGDNNRPFAWIAVIGVVVLATASISKLVTGYWKGAIVDERNRVSLSRFQLVLWTILLISGIGTAIMSNVIKHSQEYSPLSINIPPELLALMGISTTSLVGSPLFRSTKLGQTPDPAQQDNTLNQMAAQGVNTDSVGNHGSLVINASPKDARWSDLIRGEEVSNAAQFDLSRIQLLYFTALLVVGYGGALAAQFVANGAFKAFPPVDQSMVVLLGISHAGYLTSKAVPH